MPEAQRRLDAEDHPETITAFSKQLAEWLKLPTVAAPAKARTIENAFGRSWLPTDVGAQNNRPYAICAPIFVRLNDAPSPHVAGR